MEGLAAGADDGDGGPFGGLTLPIRRVEIDFRNGYAHPTYCF